MTLPLLFSAANAPLLNCTSTTPDCKLEETELNVICPAVFPHITRLPFVFKARNVPKLQYIDITSEDILEDAELESPPVVEYPHVTTEPAAIPLYWYPLP
jgi:hypothetical protein